jgi:hypothetical protein
LAQQELILFWDYPKMGLMGKMMGTINGRSWCFAMALGIAVAISPATVSAQSVSYDGTIPVNGQAYNDVLKKWSEGIIRVSVMVEPGSYEYVGFSTNVVLGTVKIRRIMTQADRMAMIGDLKKGLEWMKLALANKAKVSKMISFYGVDEMDDKICGKPPGCQVDRGQMRFDFVSWDSGRQSSVVVTIADQNNRFMRSEIHLSRAGVETFIKALQQTETLLAKARSESDKLNLFK